MIVQVQKKFNKKELEMIGYDMNSIKKIMADALSNEIMNHISLEEIDEGDFVTLRRRLFVYEKED